MSQFYYPLEHEFFVCSCMSPEHTIRWTRDPEDNQVYIYVYLAPLTFWRRLWTGLKYICGYQCRYGAFDEFILDNSDAIRLEEMAGKVKHIYLQQLAEKVKRP